MDHRGLRLIGTAFAVATVFGAMSWSHGNTSAQSPPVASSTPVPAAGQSPLALAAGNAINNSSPQRPTTNVPLSNGELRESVDSYVHTRTLAPDLGERTQTKRVEVIHTLAGAVIRAEVSRLGGVFEGEAEGLLQASVPVDQLVALENYPRC